MNVITLQIILLAFVLLMIYSLFLHWKKRDISNRLFLFWLIIFMVFMALFLLPKVFESLIKDVFVVRVMDLGIIGAFMIVTYVSIENNIKMRGLEKKIEKLVRKISLRKVKK
jgi:hypothetical protein